MQNGPIPSAETIAEQPTRVRAAVADTAPTPAAPPVASPVAASSFDYPPATEIDPRRLESIPRTQTPAATAPAPLETTRPEVEVAVTEPPAAPALSPPTPAPTMPPTSSLADLAVPPAASVPAPAAAPSAPAPIPAPAPAPAAPASVAPAPVGPAAMPHPVATASPDLVAAQNSANDAVAGALAVFGTERRTPGANLPQTSLVTSLSGVMSLDDAPVSPTPPDPVPPPTDPDEIRSQLAGFQSGTRRADQED